MGLGLGLLGLVLLVKSILFYLRLVLSVYRVDD